MGDREESLRRQPTVVQQVAPRAVGGQLEQKEIEWGWGHATGPCCVTCLDNMNFL